MNLIELAERCEAATGPDRKLDEEIYLATFLERGDWCVIWPNLTASVDAALTLVPGGWHPDGIGEDWQTGKAKARLVERPSEKLREAFDRGRTIGLKGEGGAAATIALSICAAALRARASEQNNG